jgi:hypothetical protein
MKKREGEFHLDQIECTPFFLNETQ